MHCASFEHNASIRLRENFKDVKTLERVPKELLSSDFSIQKSPSLLQILRKTDFSNEVKEYSKVLSLVETKLTENFNKNKDIFDAAFENANQIQKKIGDLEQKIKEKQSLIHSAQSKFKKSEIKNKSLQKSYNETNAILSLLSAIKDTKNKISLSSKHIKNGDHFSAYKTLLNTLSQNGGVLNSVQCNASEALLKDARNFFSESRSKIMSDLVSFLLLQKVQKEKESEVLEMVSQSTIDQEKDSKMKEIAASLLKNNDLTEAIQMVARDLKKSLRRVLSRSFKDIKREQEDTVTSYCKAAETFFIKAVELLERNCFALQNVLVLLDMQEKESKVREEIEKTIGNDVQYVERKSCELLDVGATNLKSVLLHEVGYILNKSQILAIQCEKWSKRPSEKLKTAIESIGMNCIQSKADLLCSKMVSKLRNEQWEPLRSIPDFLNAIPNPKFPEIPKFLKISNILKTKNRIFCTENKLKHKIPEEAHNDKAQKLILHDGENGSEFFVCGSVLPIVALFSLCLDFFGSDIALDFYKKRLISALNFTVSVFLQNLRKGLRKGNKTAPSENSLKALALKSHSLSMLNRLISMAENSAGEGSSGLFKGLSKSVSELKKECEGNLNGAVTEILSEECVVYLAKVKRMEDENSAGIPKGGINCEFGKGKKESGTLNLANLANLERAFVGKNRRVKTAVMAFLSEAERGKLGEKVRGVLRERFKGADGLVLNEWKGRLLSLWTL